MSSKISASPFERVSKLSAHKAGSGVEGWGVADAPGKVGESALRSFRSPEAVSGFLLEAYRPESPSQKRKLDGEQNEASECVFHTVWTLAKAPGWTDSQVEAESLIGSPQMQRTDLPLIRFALTRESTVTLDSTVTRRHSHSQIVGACSTQKVELAARSASAPGSYESLVVEELWQNLPLQPSVNPFENVSDVERIFFNPEEASDWH